MIAETIYILCGVTSIVCAILLLRQYRATPNRLLFWSAGCFLCLAASNVLLYVDLIMLPNTDLLPLRNIITLAGIAMLLTAQIIETR